MGFLLVRFQSFKQAAGRLLLLPGRDERPGPGRTRSRCQEPLKSLPNRAPAPARCAGKATSNASGSAAACDRRVSAPGKPRNPVRGESAAVSPQCRDADAMPPRDEGARPGLLEDGQPAARNTSRLFRHVAQPQKPWARASLRRLARLQRNRQGLGRLDAFGREIHRHARQHRCRVHEYTGVRAQPCGKVSAREFHSSGKGRCSGEGAAGVRRGSRTSPPPAARPSNRSGGLWTPPRLKFALPGRRVPGGAGLQPATWLSAHHSARRFRGRRRLHPQPTRAPATQGVTLPLCSGPATVRAGQHGALARE